MVTDKQITFKKPTVAANVITRSQEKKITHNKAYSMCGDMEDLRILDHGLRHAKLEATSTIELLFRNRATRENLIREDRVFYL